LAKQGAYSGPQVFGQFSDIFRAVSTQNLETGDSTTMTGFKLQPQDLLGSENALVPTKAIIYGSYSNTELGDNSAFGTEIQHQFGNLNTQLRAGIVSGLESSRHIGGTLEGKFGNLTLGVGNDFISSDSGDFNQVFGKVGYDFSPNLYGGVGFAHQDLADGTQNEKLIAGLGRFGTDKWNFRAIGTFETNPDKDITSAGGKIILVPGESTFGRTSTDSWVSNDLWNDTLFAQSASPFPFYTERMDDYERISNGLGFSGGIKYTDSAGKQSTTVYGSALYNTGKFGAMIGPAHTIMEGEDDKTRINASGTIRLGDGWTFGGGVSIPVDDSGEKPSGFLGVEKRF
jgi:hypothetical protein